jgi:hypothetical protein
MLRTAIGLVVLAHGLGHVLFLLPLLGIVDWGQSTRSWLLTNLGGTTLTQIVGGLIWVAVIAGFALTVAGMFTQQDWWRILALVSSVISLVGIVLFWNDKASSSTFFAAAFNIVVMLALLVAKWPSAELVGS